MYLFEEGVYIKYKLIKELYAMKCECGSIVNITEDNFAIINDNFVFSCNNCNRVYLESDFSQKEIDDIYYDN